MVQSNVETPPWLRGIDAAAIAGVDAALLHEVRAAYETPGRFYHTWQHIEACLEQFRLASFDNPRAVLLALLFHDAIYVAGRKDNEAKSAAFAARVIGESRAVPQAEQDSIGQMILATASHHALGTPTSDAKKMLDIDLSILGADWTTYQAYARDVRREFCPQVVSEFKFCIGRLQFLRAVQKQTHIFLTDDMRARREAQARENMAREVLALEAEAGMVGRVLAKLV